MKIIIAFCSSNIFFVCILNSMYASRGLELKIKALLSVVVYQRLYSEVLGVAWWLAARPTHQRTQTNNGLHGQATST